MSHYNCDKPGHLGGICCECNKKSDCIWPVEEKPPKTIPEAPQEQNELRELIAKVMMDGWLANKSAGTLHIDGGKSSITRNYVNPKVLDKLVALLQSHHNKLLQETEKAYGGCHNCYGKGYATKQDFVQATATGRKWPAPPIKFCTCDRGKQLAAHQTARDNKLLTELVGKLPEPENFGNGFDDLIHKADVTALLMGKMEKK